MQFVELIKPENFESDTKLSLYYKQFEDLLKAIQKHDIPQEIQDFINAGIERQNKLNLPLKSLRKDLRTFQNEIVKRLEKELKLVPINYYRYLWMAIGVGAFGLPLGVAFGSAAGNMGMIGVGLPLGLVIGMAFGSKLDKKAKEQGRQLDVELKQ